VRDNYLVNTLRPLAGGVWGGIPGEPARRTALGATRVPRRRVQVADVQEARGRCLGVEVIYRNSRAAMYSVRTNVL